MRLINIGLCLVFGLGVHAQKLPSEFIFTKAPLPLAMHLRL